MFEIFLQIDRRTNEQEWFLQLKKVYFDFYVAVAHAENLHLVEVEDLWIKNILYLVAILSIII